MTSEEAKKYYTTWTTFKIKGQKNLLNWLFIAENLNHTKDSCGIIYVMEEYLNTPLHLYDIYYSESRRGYIFTLVVKDNAYHYDYRDIILKEEKERPKNPIKEETFKFDINNLPDFY